MTVECAVCELELEIEDAADSAVVDEKRYYLCSDKCSKEFHENPELYVEEWDEDET